MKTNRMTCYKIFYADGDRREDITELVTGFLTSVTVGGFADVADARMALAFFSIGKADEWWKEYDPTDTMKHLWHKYDLMQQAMAGETVQLPNGDTMSIERSECEEGSVYR